MLWFQVVWSNLGLDNNWFSIQKRWLLRPPTVNKARPGHERETEIKLFDYFKTIVRTYSHTHRHRWRGPRVESAGADVGSAGRMQCARVHVWHVRCPDSELVVMTEHEPSPRAFVSRSLFSSFVCFPPSTPCVVGQSTQRQFSTSFSQRQWLFCFCVQRHNRGFFLFWTCFQNLDTATGSVKIVWKHQNFYLFSPRPLPYLFGNNLHYQGKRYRKGLISVGSLCTCRIGLMMASWIRDSLVV